MRWGLEVYLEVFHALLTIPDSYYPLLSPSENFRFPEVLPDVPPVVLLDVHLEVHLEVLTYSDYT